LGRVDAKPPLEPSNLIDVCLAERAVPRDTRDIAMQQRLRIITDEVAGIVPIEGYFLARLEQLILAVWGKGAISRQA
jgi:hypothetical protein